MSARVYALTDDGYGDSAKGNIALERCIALDADEDVRTGGPQAFHAVTKGRLSFIHSQFGSGTLAGVRTHLSSNMIVEPYKFLNEARDLQNLGITNPVDLVTIDEEALVIVPFQAIANRLLEIGRGENPRGTVGIGVGETVADSEILGDGAVRVKDLGKPWLREKIVAIREHKLRELAPILDRIAAMSDRADRDLNKLYDESLIDEVVKQFNYLAKVVQIVDSSYLGQILETSKAVVFEPSQGVLLDRWYGWHPFTTLSRPMPDAIDELLEKHQFQGEVTRLALIRAYQHRHGCGPFVTEDADLTRLLPDLNNGTNEWQGSFRVGHLDMVALKYAIEACGGTKAFDGLAVSCLDQMSRLSSWQICESYQAPVNEPNLDKFFEIDPKSGAIIGIKVRKNTKDQAQFDHQEELGKLLKRCKPNLTEISSLSAGFNISDLRTQYGNYLEAIAERLNIPIAIASYGPTEKDKVIYPACNISTSNHKQICQV